MPDLIPFIPSENNRLGVPMGDERVYFRTRWNSRDNDGAGAWYFDLFDEKQDPILLGIKVVLGVHLGANSTADFFTKHILTAVDTTGKGIEAGFDDLGGRVIMTHYTADEIQHGTVNGNTTVGIG